MSSLSREYAMQKLTNRKSQVSKNVKLDNLLKKRMCLLYTNPTLKTVFLQGCINSAFKRNQSVKELLVPSLYPNKKVIRTNSITGCNNCNICKNYLICSNKFRMQCHQ